MLEHLTEKTIELFLARKLNPNELVDATRHVAVCDACRQKLSEAKGVSASVRYLNTDLQSAITPQNHLSYEQLEAYVDESLKQSENEKVNQHLADCAACAKEARELAQLRDNLSAYPNTAPSVRNIVATQKENFWKKLTAFLQIKPLQAVGFAAAVLLLTVTMILVYRTMRKPSDVANTNNANQSQTANANITTPTNKNQNDTRARTINSNQQPDKKNENIGGRQRTPLVAKNNQGEQVAFSAYDNVVKQTVSRQTIVLPSVVKDLNGRESRLMGNNDSTEKFNLLSPYGTVVQNSRPTFRWQPLNGANSYTVYLLNTDFEVVEKSRTLTNESWTATQPLRRGKTFVWQVVAEKNGKEIAAPVAPAKEARFKVLDRKTFQKLQRFAQSKKNNHLTLGIIYAHHGLLDDAERELETAIASQQSPELARKLLQNLKAMRR
jgi:predicted anti-sigma-YlaC factor YlaD